MHPHYGWWVVKQEEDMKELSLGCGALIKLMDFAFFFLYPRLSPCLLPRPPFQYLHNYSPRAGVMFITGNGRTPAAI